MNRILSPIAIVLLLSACSTPKYTYYFDTYPSKPVAKSKVEENIPAINPATLTASASDEPVILEAPVETPPVPTAAEVHALKSELKSMSRQEKKALRKELMNELKDGTFTVKANDSVTTTDGVQAMDNDLKFALIFAIVSIVLSIFSGTLGLIALIVALFFLVRWIIRQ